MTDSPGEYRSSDPASEPKTRDRILDALQNRLSPGQMLDRGIGASEATREQSRQAGAGLSRLLREQPLLVGVFALAAGFGELSSTRTH